MHNPPLIIGAGLAGLSCGKHLNSTYRLIEQAQGPGGTARSVHYQGFTFDITGHWLHLRDEGMRTLVKTLLGDTLIEVERRAAIFMHDRYIPYPFQANTFGLPPEVVAECVLGFFQAREQALRKAHPPARNFEMYIRQRLGNGIAEHFMIPYNHKIWTVHPSALSAASGGRFVPLPSAEEVVRGAVFPNDTGTALGYNSKFLYPRDGGIQPLAEALAQSLTIPPEYGKRVVEIDLPRRTIMVTPKNESIVFGPLVSTLPLTTLLDLLTEVLPADIARARSLLRATQVTYWDIGVRGDTRPNTPHWIYFPEPDYPFYRVGCGSAAVSSLAPQGCRSHYVEVAHAQGTTCTVQEAELISGLRKARVLREDLGDELLFCRRSNINPGYVIMDHAYEEARSTCLNWLEAQQIYSIGRYGAWIYDSMEGAMLQGRDTARRLELA